jgi:hypothetical protein
MKILDSGALSLEKTVWHRQPALRYTAIYPIWASMQNWAIRKPAEFLLRVHSLHARRHPQACGVPAPENADIP